MLFEAEVEVEVVVRVLLLPSLSSLSLLFRMLPARFTTGAALGATGRIGMALLLTSS
jgi:hypothetical protein